MTPSATIAGSVLDSARIGGAGSQHSIDGQPWFHLAALLLELPQDLFEKLVLAVRLHRQLDEEFGLHQGG